MASDNLRQVGKYIGETREKTNYALGRYYPNYPVIERSRDIFDASNSFDMYFKTESDRLNHVVLDLFFNFPPPLGQSTYGCIKSKCKRFIFSDGEDHIVNVGEEYLTDSVTVFRNGIQLNSDSFYEMGSGEVFFKGSGFLENTSPENVVLDNFDRTESSGFGTSSGGHVWSINYEQDGTISVNGSEGVFNCYSPDWKSSQLYSDITSGVILLEDVPINVIVKFKFNQVPPSSEVASFWFIAYDSSSLAGVMYQLDINNNTSGLISIDPNLGGSGGETSIAKTDWLSDTYYYFKIYQNPITNECKIKLWEATSSEPSSWTLETIVTGITLYTNIPYLELGCRNSTESIIFYIDSFEFTNLGYNTPIQDIVDICYLNTSDC